MILWTSVQSFMVWDVIKRSASSRQSIADEMAIYERHMCPRKDRWTPSPDNNFFIPHAIWYRRSGEKTWQLWTTDGSMAEPG